ncbi:MAG: cytochrome c, class I [Robiginitomaculum sp.]|nr:MAG: cytochrome c, class I [Robiginitomaculum sp.]
MKTMKNNRFWIGSTLVITMLVFAPLAVAGQDSASSKAKKADPMQVVRGAKAWKNNCGRCHNLRSPKELTDEEWDVSVTHMRIRANLLPLEADDIKAFLKASN